MRDLILEEKTGFESYLPFKILDSKNMLFYDDTFCSTLKEKGKVKFNLPAGTYKYDGSFHKLPFPVPTINISLPAPERNMQGSKRYNIIFGDNPNKCTIFYDDGVILFDNSFLNKPLFVRYGVYFHELGHHYYKTEWKADLYATKKMLDYGFNPSQVGLVGLLSLSNRAESFDRKAKTVKILTKKK